MTLAARPKITDLRWKKRPYDRWSAGEKYDLRYKGAEVATVYWDRAEGYRWYAYGTEYGIPNTGQSRPYPLEELETAKQDASCFVRAALEVNANPSPELLAVLGNAVVASVRYTTAQESVRIAEAGLREAAEASRAANGRRDAALLAAVKLRLEEDSP